MALEVIAPAKVNLTLEVLGKRPDGYHEIASIMQTISLADIVRLYPADDLALEVNNIVTEGTSLPSTEDNLAFRAAQALRELVGRMDLGATIVLFKQIPVSAGLGGGSSDAAAVLRGLDRLWNLNLGLDVLTDVAARLGSDVPFFLHGGTCLATGRGEIVEQLADLSPTDFVIFVPDAEIEEKTPQMYSALTPSDFSDGSYSRKLVELINRGLSLRPDEPVNVFDRHVQEIDAQAASAMASARAAGIPVVSCGSGPAFFAIQPLGGQSEIIQPLHRSGVMSNLEVEGGRAITRADALLITEGIYG